MKLSDAQKAPRRRTIKSHASEMKIEPEPKRGRPSNKRVAKLKQDLGISRATAFRKLAKRQARQQTMRERLDASPARFNPLIKPSDTWNFHEVLYPRIDDDPD